MSSKKFETNQKDRKILLKLKTLFYFNIQGIEIPTLEWNEREFCKVFSLALI